MRTGVIRNEEQQGKDFYSLKLSLETRTSVSETGYRSLWMGKRGPADRERE